MKIITSFTLLYAFLLIFNSCKKSETDTNPRIPPGVILEIKPGNYSYVAENGNHYYSGSFSSNNDTDLYRLKVSAGKKYSVFCTQQGTSNSAIEILLTNSVFDTILYNYSYYYSTGSFFTSDFTEELYLQVRLKGYNNGSLKYNVFFETDLPLPFTYKNHKWEGIGQWNVIDSNRLEFSCSDSKKYRWLMLLSSVPDDAEISFTLKSTTFSYLPNLGIVLGGSTNLFKEAGLTYGSYNYGAFFLIEDNTRYSLTFFTGSGYSNSGGYMYLPNFDLSAGINLEVINANSYYNRRITINNSLITDFNSTGTDRLYLVVLDEGFNKLTIENLIIQ